MLQESCDGRGKDLLKRDCKSLSVLQCHRCSEPNERDGMSGEQRSSCRRSASARSSCMAIVDCRDAIRSTQCTVGELSLNSATWAPVSSGHVASIVSQSSISPAISRSELVMVPLGLCWETRAAETSGGHCRRKTVGTIDLFSPMMIPPTP
jgi:hypothetical protein